MPRLERTQKRILLLSNKQIFQIFKNTNKDFALIATIALNTGLRLSELLSVRVSDFDLQNRMLNVPLKNTKTKKHERTIPLNTSVITALKIIKTQRKDSDFLTDYSDQAFKMTCYRASKKLGFLFSFHSFRHTFITALYNSSKNAYLTASIAGHGSIYTTMTYVHATSEEALRAVEGIHFSNSSNETRKDNVFKIAH